MHAADADAVALEKQIIRWCWITCLRDDFSSNHHQHVPAVAQVQTARHGTTPGILARTLATLPLLPFYTSGVNALFAVINGAYQPIINMDVSLPLLLCVFFPSVHLLLGSAPSSSVSLSAYFALLPLVNAFLVFNNYTYLPVASFFRGHAIFFCFLLLQSLPALRLCSSPFPFLSSASGANQS